MTVTVPKRDVRLLAVLVAFLFVAVAILGVLMVATNLNVQRVSHTQDRMDGSVTRTDQNVAATQKVLFETVAAIQLGSPQAAFTRAQVDAICRSVAVDCPPAAPEVAPPKAEEQR